MLDLAGELLERLRDATIRELEVRRGGVRVRVSKDGAPAAASAVLAPAQAAEVTVPRSGGQPAAKPAPKAIAAPLTGIFYRSPSPQASPFVRVGSVVNVGDVIGLIEAMKLFNEVRSTLAGRVRRVAAENGQLVRAHQPLIELE